MNISAHADKNFIFIYLLLLLCYSPQHIHRLTQNNTSNFEEGEFDKKEGGLIIYSDTALEKFIAYSKESHRGRKKKES